MESWVSSNCTRNIYRPSTPEKEVNREENTVGKITNRRQIATDSKVYACSDTDWRSSILLRAVFATKKIGIFRARLIAFPLVEFEVDEENKQLQVAKKISAFK